MLTTSRFFLETEGTRSRLRAEGLTPADHREMKAAE
jgi:hypothetical protein